MFQANERKGIERRRCDQTRSFKMEMGSDLLSLTNPVLYAGSALVIALVALGAMVFTLIRQRRLLDAKLKSTNKTLKQQTEKSSASASSNTEKTEDQPKAQEKNYDAALTGKWPATLGEGEDALRDLVKDMEVDPVEFCEHIPGKVKQVKAKVAQKKIEEQMSEEQKESERDVQREQLESIFKLLKEQEDKFGIKSMDDMEQQMSMYVTK